MRLAPFRLVDSSWVCTYQLKLGTIRTLWGSQSQLVMVERFGEHCIRGTVAAVGQCFTLQRQAVCLEGQQASQRFHAVFRENTPKGGKENAAVLVQKKSDDLTRRGRPLFFCLEGSWRCRRLHAVAGPPEHYYPLVLIQEQVREPAPLHPPRGHAAHVEIDQSNRQRQPLGVAEGCTSWRSRPARHALLHHPALAEPLGD